MLLHESKKYMFLITLNLYFLGQMFLKHIFYWCTKEILSYGKGDFRKNNSSILNSSREIFVDPLPFRYRRTDISNNSLATEKNEFYKF